MISTRAVKEENPRSRVMPRSLLCGCLSSAAVDSFVDNAATVGIVYIKFCHLRRQCHCQIRIAAASSTELIG